MLTHSTKSGGTPGDQRRKSVAQRKTHMQSQRLHPQGQQRADLLHLRIRLRGRQTYAHRVVVGLGSAYTHSSSSS